MSKVMVGSIGITAAKTIGDYDIMGRYCCSKGIMARVWIVERMPYKSVVWNIEGSPKGGVAGCWWIRKRGC
jgi:hypothetical protein